MTTRDARKTPAKPPGFDAKSCIPACGLALSAALRTARSGPDDPTKPSARLSAAGQPGKVTAACPSIYIYRWGKYRPAWKGRACRVIARGSLNSALIEFVETGERAVISRQALRRASPKEERMSRTR